MSTTTGEEGRDINAFLDRGMTRIILFRLNSINKIKETTERIARDRGSALLLAT